MATAPVLSRVMQRSPLHVDARDPVVYGAVALLLGAAAMAAMLSPAGRASKADPLAALREE